MRQIVPVADITRRMPEAGRIRIGEKKGNRPTAIGEFRFTSHDRAALEQIAAMYGGTVRPWSDPKAAEGQHEVRTAATEIRIVLPPDPLGGSPIYEMWTGGGCERRCDGVTATTYQRGPEGPEPVEVPCICTADQAMACKVKTRLVVILPEVRFAGVWRLDTSSWNAAQEIPGMVDVIQSMQAKGMPYATLGLKHRRSVAAGKTSKFLVPVLGLAVSPEELMAGAANMGSIGQGAPAPAIGSGEITPPPARPALPEPADLDDEYVDAEVVVDGPPLADAEALAELQRQIDQLDTDSKADLATWWKNIGYPGIKSGAMTVDHVAEVSAAVASYLGEPPAPSSAARNRKMHAMVAEAWPDLDAETRETRRKGLIGVIADGATSSKDLNDSGWDDLFTALEEITAGRSELHRRANGDFELRGKR